MARELKTWVSASKVTLPLSDIPSVGRNAVLAGKLEMLLHQARARKAQDGHGDCDEVAVDLDVVVRIYYNVEQEVETDGDPVV